MTHLIYDEMHNTNNVLANFRTLDLLAVFITKLLTGIKHKSIVAIHCVNRQTSEFTVGTVPSTLYIILQVTLFAHMVGINCKRSFYLNK